MSDDLVLLTDPRIVRDANLDYLQRLGPSILQVAEGSARDLIGRRLVVDALRTVRESGMLQPVEFDRVMGALVRVGRAYPGASPRRVRFLAALARDVRRPA